jgi:hypothetical protein
MIVMPSNNSGFEAGLLFGKYPNKLAALQDPVAPKEPKIGIPWAVDNGVYGAFVAKREWNEEPFYAYLDKYSAWNPLWVAVPDAVGNRDATLRKWDEHYPAVSAFGIPLAFVVQDGMVPADVPDETASTIFVGGSTSWKWRNLKMWREAFPKKTLHVGRVNTRRLLCQAAASGADSCDGTGWFRDPFRTMELEAWLKDPSEHPQLDI